MLDEADETIDTFDELVRQRDELRAENTDLLAQANRTAGIYEKEIDMLRAENDRLRAHVAILTEEAHCEIERLRAALIAGRATHGELCQAGAECQFIRDANAALADHKEC